MMRTIVFLALVGCSGPAATVDAASIEDAPRADAVRPDAGGCTVDDLPTATSVGIPTGTTLTPMTDSMHTDHDGQVFEGIDFQARLYVDHANVVIRSSRLVGDEYYAVYATDEAHDLTIETSEILGGVLAPDGFVARRNYVHSPAGGARDDGFIFAASHVLIEDNRIDGLVGGDGAHVDGIQIMAGEDVVIRHNWIDASSPPINGGGVNAAIFFAPDMGPIADVTVECNELIAHDAYYPLRIEAGGTVVVRHNRWGRGHLGSPVLISGATTVSEWTDNQYDDGEVIDAP